MWHSQWAAERRKLLASGMAGPTCWYKVMVRDIEAEDAKRE